MGAEDISWHQLGGGYGGLSPAPGGSVLSLTPLRWAARPLRAAQVGQHFRPLRLAGITQIRRSDTRVSTLAWRGNHLTVK